MLSVCVAIYVQIIYVNLVWYIMKLLLVGIIYIYIILIKNSKCKKGG